MYNHGDYRALTVRASAILTNSYVAGTVIGPNNLNDGTAVQTEVMNQLVILADFTIGSLTDAQIKVEFSNDNSTYFQETAILVSGGVSTVSQNVYKLTATGKYEIKVPIKAKFIKISSIGTGTTTNSLLAITALVGVV